LNTILYSTNDQTRLKKPEEYSKAESEEYRTEFRRDYARLVHSPSFRRLQGKTQLFPGVESDFFRNRLTHSLEVAQIAKSIALRVNYLYNPLGQLRKANEEEFGLDTDLIEFSGLAHDLGHPPFGHQGEEALDECMLDYGGFEGNAQTFRILSKLEKKIVPEPSSSIETDSRIGLNLTYRTLASILKYDFIIPKTGKDREIYAKKIGSTIKPVKGCYYFDRDLIEKIKANVRPSKTDSKLRFKTIECQIMDIADDIAYSTYDLEDAIKARFISPMDLLFPNQDLMDKVVEDVNSVLRKEGINTVYNEQAIRDFLRETCSIFFEPDYVQEEIAKVDDKDELHGLLSYIYGSVYEASKFLMTDSTYRTALTSGLVGRGIREVQLIANTESPKFFTIRLTPRMRAQVETRKRFVYRSIIESPRMEVVAYRGKQIVRDIFETLASKDGWRLLPKDSQKIYESMEDIGDRKRVICDFVASMTDRYAVEFYSRLHSTSPETIFKPF
jgi:dGTPase